MAEWDLRLVPPCPGARISQNFGDTDSGYPHRGTDFGVPVGTPVQAPCDGLVVDFTNSWTIWNGQQVRSFGNGVCLWHRDSGLYVLLAHLSQVDVYVGQEVSQEQPLGLSGNTGVSTGPHLHLQVCTSPSFPVDISQSRDPLRYWHPEDIMTPTQAALLRLVARALTGVLVDDDMQLLAAMESQYAQLAAGSSIVLQQKILWNNLARHLNAPGVVGADGLHPGAYVWKDF